MNGSKPVSIAKKPFFPEYGYETLRKEGLQVVQNLCGKLWTDFNPHDPGVTILEQIVFALSELGYKTQFDIQDYLAGTDDENDYSAQGLFPPEIVFPGNPVTTEDYAKFLYANIPEIENVSLKYEDEKGYVLRIVPVDALPDIPKKNSMEQRLKNRVESFFLLHRNLGDVIGEINFDWKKKCYLDGELEITGMRPVADILADLNLFCSRCFSSPIAIERYDGPLVQKMALEKVFDGPLSTIGFLKEDCFADRECPLLLAELKEAIQRILGISKIRSLSLKGFDASFLDGTDRSHLQLDFEQSIKHIKFFLGDRLLPSIDYSSLDRMRNQVSKRIRSPRNPILLEELRKLLPELPKGVRPEIKEFSPIIDQFPPIYETKDTSGKLQTFLSPVEFLFQDFLRKLDGFSELFSIRGKMTNLGRCNSVLDQMLAVYGFRFPDALFLTLRGRPSSSIPLEMIRAKQKCLENWPEFSRQRGGLRWLHRIGMMIGVDFDSLSLDKKPLFVDGSCLKDFENQILIVWPKKSPYMEQETNRLAVDEFICDEVPAHLVPCIYWVDEENRRTFQNCYFRWIRSEKEDLESLNLLVDWFQKHSNALSGHYWI